MDIVQNQAWEAACSMTPREVMSFYRNAGQQDPLHLEVYENYRKRGEFSSVNQMFHFYSDAADMHEAAYLANQFETKGNA